MPGWDAGSAGVRCRRSRGRMAAEPGPHDGAAGAGVRHRRRGMPREAWRDARTAARSTFAKTNRRRCVLPDGARHLFERPLHAFHAERDLRRSLHRLASDRTCRANRSDSTGRCRETTRLRATARRCTCMYMTRRAARKRMTAAEARRRWAEVLDTARSGTPVEVTRNGEPIAAVVSVERLGELDRETVSDVVARFRACVDPMVLAGPDPWAGVRDRGGGRARANRQDARVRRRSDRGGCRGARPHARHPQRPRLPIVPGPRRRVLVHASRLRKDARAVRSTRLRRTRRRRSSARAS
jgi:prevent-host-death family protein